MHKEEHNNILKQIPIISTIDNYIDIFTDYLVEYAFKPLDSDNNFEWLYLPMSEWKHKDAEYSLTFKILFPGLFLYDISSIITAQKQKAYNYWYAASDLVKNIDISGYVNSAQKGLTSKSQNVYRSMCSTIHNIKINNYVNKFADVNLNSSNYTIANGVQAAQNYFSSATTTIKNYVNLAGSKTYGYADSIMQDIKFNNYINNFHSLKNIVIDKAQTSWNYISNTAKNIQTQKHNAYNYVYDAVQNINTKQYIDTLNSAKDTTANTLQTIVDLNSSKNYITTEAQKAWNDLSSATTTIGNYVNLAGSKMYSYNSIIQDIKFNNYVNNFHSLKNSVTDKVQNLWSSANDKFHSSKDAIINQAQISYSYISNAAKNIKIENHFSNMYKIAFSSATDVFNVVKDDVQTIVNVFFPSSEFLNTEYNFVLPHSLPSDTLKIYKFPEYAESLVDNSNTNFIYTTFDKTILNQKEIDEDDKADTSASNRNVEENNRYIPNQNKINLPRSKEEVIDSLLAKTVGVVNFGIVKQTYKKLYDKHELFKDVLSTISTDNDFTITLQSNQVQCGFGKSEACYTPLTNKASIGQADATHVRSDYLIHELVHKYIHQRFNSLHPLDKDAKGSFGYVISNRAGKGEEFIANNKDSQIAVLDQAFKDTLFEMTKLSGINIANFNEKTTWQIGTEMQTRLGKPNSYSDPNYPISLMLDLFSGNYPKNNLYAEIFPMSFEIIDGYGYEGGRFHKMLKPLMDYWHEEISLV